MVDHRFFTVNSHFFRAHRRRDPSLIPVLRTGGLSTPVESLSGLHSAFSRFVSRHTGEARLRAEAMFLSQRASSIRQSGRSVIRGLGIPASIEGLHRAGLWRRECWYAETLPTELPLPSDPCRLKWCKPPSDWHRVPVARPKRSDRRRHKELELAFNRELVSRSWFDTAPPKGEQLEEYLRQCTMTGHEVHYRDWLRLRRVAGKGLYRGVKQPACRGRGKVESWVVDGVPSRVRRGGVGYRASPVMVWLPDMPEQPEESVGDIEGSWRRVSNYESFLVGAA